MEYLCQLMEGNLKKKLAQIVESLDHLGHKYRDLPSTGINHPLALVKISMHPLQFALGVLHKSSKLLCIYYCAYQGIGTYFNLHCVVVVHGGGGCVWW